MNGKGAGSGGDDCFAKFDEAFAKLEADLKAVSATAANLSTRPDLSEYEAAFDSIDRQLAAYPDPTAGARPDPAHDARPDPAHDARSTHDARPDPALFIDPIVFHPEVHSTTAAPLATEPCSVANAGATPEPAPRSTLALVPPHGAPADTGGVAALVPSDLEEMWQRRSGGTPLERLVVSIQNLLSLQRRLSGSGRGTDRARWEQLAALFNEVRQVCSDFDFQTSRVRVEFALKALNTDRADRLVFEITELVRHLRHDLQSCSIVPLARERVWAFSLALDDASRRAFPATAKEIGDAGRCFGHGLFAAAAFHLLRAAEHGRRAVALAVRFDDREREAADWAGTVTALQTRMMDLAGWPAGPPRKAIKDFLTALISDAREMAEARRRLDEGEPFEDCHAMALWYATRDFLALASERVSEHEDGLLKPDQFIPH